ncbi:MAG: sensor domain-containing protein [Candidatus Pristimantibacillus lignocellulolyticus]|uniref:Sensor domain-containing protein n=1 Tax=Candidatus Pristimantibacillus lignocellulolyticus TaxID=2994561 RepID=A0A9J6ZAT6_9BACL|nr:MAG: sensor domain-containing protein [Candidatus Pristimantibacillus lignocellulolyticus]
MKAIEVTDKTSTGKVNWVLFNPKTYATILYFLLSLPLGIIYFTIAITGIVLSIGLAPIFIGIPLFFGVAKLLNGIVNFEQNMIRQILGLPTPAVPHSYNGQSETRQNWFMQMVRGFDGKLFIRNLLLVLLRFVTSIVFFVIMITVISLALGFITLPALHIILMNEIQLDILEHSLFSYFHIDWTLNQQYMLYVGFGLVLFWIALRIVNGLMQIQRRIMYVDEPYEQTNTPVQAESQMQTSYYDFPEDHSTQVMMQPAYKEI